MDNKDILTNLKLIKSNGKQHKNGQIILIRLNRFINNYLPNCKWLMSESLVENGIETLRNVVQDLGVRIANALNQPNTQKRINSLLDEMSKVCHQFNSDDKYVRYDLSNGKLIYSWVTLDDGLKVINDIIKEFNK